MIVIVTVFAYSRTRACVCACHMALLVCWTKLLPDIRRQAYCYADLSFGTASGTNSPEKVMSLDNPAGLGM